MAVVYSLLQPLAILNSPVAAAPVAPVFKPVTLIQPLQAVVPPELSQVPDIPVYTPPAPVSTGCGDNEYANFIYMKESGCRTDAINPIGACGIGQAWPCSKMGCSLSDYACQNAYFTAYANSTYGGWYNAYQYWISNSWW